jgi:hypothetical protein
MVNRLPDYEQRRTSRSKHYHSRMAEVTSSSLVGSTPKPTVLQHKTTEHKEASATVRGFLLQPYYNEDRVRTCAKQAASSLVSGALEQMLYSILHKTFREFTF